MLYLEQPLSVAVNERTVLERVHEAPFDSDCRWQVTLLRGTQIRPRIVRSENRTQHRQTLCVIDVDAPELLTEVNMKGSF